MSSPWAKIATPDPVNFQDIMSEELSRDVQEKESRKAVILFPEDDFVIIPELPKEEISLKSDEEIASLLQQQFDNEHDDKLRRTEEKFNGASKVSISFSNYRRVLLNGATYSDLDCDSDPEELEDIRDNKDWDRFDTILRKFDMIPECTSKKNACQMMSFLLEFETGDGGSFNKKITNKLVNSLKMHSKHEQKQSTKHKMKDHDTAILRIDGKTRIVLYKWVNAQLLNQVNTVISIGKEAVVLHGYTNPKYPNHPLPTECAIKVFKTTILEYKQGDKYIRDDYRFKDRFGKTNGEITTAKLLQIQAKKEMHNLHRLKRAGVLCPEVVALKGHVLAMSFIGKDNKAAPKLKDANLDVMKLSIAYEQVMQYMKIMYKECNLIHGDLSEHNILWYDNNCYIIDVSQAVEASHENAFLLLFQDCEKICKFFTKNHVSNVITPKELFEDITGLDYANKIAQLEMQESIKVKPHLKHLKKTYEFDNAPMEKLPEPGLTCTNKLHLTEAAKA